MSRHVWHIAELGTDTEQRADCRRSRHGDGTPEDDASSAPHDACTTCRRTKRPQDGQPEARLAGAYLSLANPRALAGLLQNTLP